LDGDIVSNVKATELLRMCIIYSEVAFAELALWQLPKPVPGSTHGFKYRLAYVVTGECVLRYDNEVGKGDHRHSGGRERAYEFTTLEQLAADFQRDIGRWNRENRGS
jgi:Family of unknown function (DUF6516)